MSMINTSRQDAAFKKHVEEHSGQSLSACYQCGNCTAGCPASFAYDMQVNSIMRALQLGQKEQVLESKSIWMCLSCSTCSLRCPNNIDVAAIMETLRHEALREKRVSRSEAKKMQSFWNSFLQTVRQFGRTYEIGVMALYMMRTLRVFTDVDLAPAALMKNKLGFKPHKSSNDGPNGDINAVSRIMQRYEERTVLESQAHSAPEKCCPAAITSGSANALSKGANA
ncbi:MAG: 4Fe-4S dicluster domain-containing protein [Pseudomonadota bacterium]